MNGIQRQSKSASGRPASATAAIVSVAMALLCGSARGDGGTLRLSEIAGPYRLSVFTSPSPPRAGRLDVSVLVQDAATGAILPNAAVSVRVASTARPDVLRTYAATRAAATNKLLRAAICELPAAGGWRIEVSVEGQAAGRNAADRNVAESDFADSPIPAERANAASAAFALVVGEPAPAWWDMSLWIGWPALAIGLFGVHKVLAARTGRKHSPRSHPGDLPG